MRERETETEGKEGEKRLNSGDQRNSTGVKALALYMADPSSILAPSFEYRARRSDLRSNF